MTLTLPVSYFGKLPCCGDFVRSASNPALLQSLDQWLSSGVELLAEDVHWKAIYDRADAADFVMLSAHRTMAVVGHIAPSADTSGRRFPFVIACAIESENGSDFMGLAPLLLDNGWQRFADATQRAQAATAAQATSILAELGQQTWPGLPPFGLTGDQYKRFLEQTTLSGFVQVLNGPGVEHDFRQSLLALGLLLQPLMHSVAQPVEKGLSLPLPISEFDRPLVAAFWMDLVSRFLKRSAYDLTLLLPRGVNHKPCLMIGFSAGAASVLQGLLDPRVTDEVFLNLNESSWVENYVADDYALKKLSSYLQLPQMSLAQVLTTFQEAFLGD